MIAVSRLLFFILLFSLVPRPSGAQHLRPAGARTSDIASASSIGSASSSNARFTSVTDTMPEPRREIRPVGTIIGGVLGGVAGTFLGGMAGAAAVEGCQGEWCGVGSVLLGAALGESLGIGIGAHIGSGSTRHANIATTSLASAGILVAGTLMGAALGHGELSTIMIPVTPALQLAAALAIESH
jgi:hypothetical protein